MAGRPTGLRALRPVMQSYISTSASPTPLMPMSSRSIASSCLRAMAPTRRQNMSRPLKTPAARFSTTQRLMKRKKGGEPTDPRVKLIRYHLDHPRLPRPLRLSRTRSLRHWTIHRAWQLCKRQQREANELELERQYNSMREACEALRLMDEDGMVEGEGNIQAGNVAPGVGAQGQQEGGRDVGRLYRIAMEKKGIWQGLPIEYARIQTEYPSRTGWNHEWKRQQ